MNAKTKVLVITAILIISIVSAIAVYSSLPYSPATDSEKLQVVTSFFPMYDFSRNVGGDEIEAIVLVPAGMEVHDWEPSTDDIQRALSADVFVYSGLGVEPWIETLKDAAFGSQVVFVETSQGLDNELLKYEEGSTDPHVWLDPIIAKYQVKKIKEAFSQLDPENADYYEINAQQYKAELDGLDVEIRDTLNQYEKKGFISFHEAFSYFAKRYGLEQTYLLARGQEEPSPADVAAVIEYAKEKNITVIYAEPLSDPSLAEEVASQIVNCRVLVLNPLEEVTIADIEAGKNYFNIMRENLFSLKEGLK